MRTILNIIWLVLCGFWMAIAYAIAGLFCFLFFFLVITIPFGIAAFRIAGYVLWPFGRTIEQRRSAGIGSLIGNILWIIFLGWELALAHLITGVPGTRPGYLNDPDGVDLTPPDSMLIIHAATMGGP